MKLSRNSAFARLSRRMFPRIPDFQSLLDDQCRVAVAALEALVAFTEAGRSSEGDRVRALEKEGDRLRLRNLDLLARAFATPFDREDIYRAVISIDDVVNYAKTTVREIDALSVQPDAHIHEMARELLAGARALREGFLRLRDPSGVQAHVAAVHKSERNVEKAYRQAVAELFSPERRLGLLRSGTTEGVAQAFEQLLDALRRREVYRHLSNAADRLDEAGRALDDIVIGNV